MWRRIGAITLIALGTVIAVAGLAPLADAAALAWRHIDIVILTLAVLVFLGLSAPKGSLTVPVALAAVGLAILAARHGFVTRGNLRIAAGVAVVALGSWLVLASSARDRDWTDPVQRFVVVLFRRELCPPPSSVVPRHLAVTAVGGTAVVDLRHCRRPGRAPAVEVAINCYAGRVEVLVPDDWTVAAGRVHLSWAVTFAGELDLLDPVRFREELTGKAAERLERVLVLHVMGAAGMVSVSGGKQGQPSPPSLSPSPPASSPPASSLSPGSDVAA